jgi:hypothetical protein
MVERLVKYVRHDDRGPSVPVEAPLWGFLLDVPYLGAAGVFPPLRLLNQVLAAGGKKWVVGATWEPFQITADEYQEAIPNVLVPPSQLLERYSRTPWQVFELDPELDDCADYDEWFKITMHKHGQAWGLRMALTQHQMVMRAKKEG